jgi:hypothetical protein
VRWAEATDESGTGETAREDARPTGRICPSSLQGVHSFGVPGNEVEVFIRRALILT